MQLVLVVVITLVVVQTKNRMVDMQVMGRTMTKVVDMLAQAKVGHKHLHTQMQYILEVVDFLIHLITMVVVVLGITEVVVLQILVVLLVVLEEVLDFLIQHMSQVHQ